MSDFINVAIGSVWAFVMFASYSVILRRDMRRYSAKHDRRNIRALLTSFALWMTAVLFASALFVSVVLDVGSAGLSLRGLLFTMGLGAFTGHGVLAAFDKSR